MKVNCLKRKRFLLKKSESLKKIDFLRLSLLRKNICDLRLNSIHNSFKQLEFQIKTVLQILFKYHITGKRIMFAGIPLKTLDECLKTFHVLRKSRHLFIPEKIWVRGTLTNKRRVQFLLRRRQVAKNKVPFIRQVRNSKKIELIILFNKRVSESVDIMREANSLRIPIIVFNSFKDGFRTNTFYFNSDFPVIGNFDFRNPHITKLVLTLFSMVFKFKRKKLFRTTNHVTSQIKNRGKEKFYSQRKVFNKNTR